MKKACRFVALTAALAITASLAVPAFAKSDDDKESTASVFTTMVGEYHSIVNPTTGEAATSPATSTTTDGTAATAPAASATTVDSLTTNWLSFPGPSDDSN
ncbi:hypothetical protein [Brevibacillus brevis]|uniref:Uncharacterized protein n=1 Tax=Brevibacillus brevis TaxID=1393 RepID=A0ABY9T979_BREBE|nr:hypothetical protein [Brevibacillus brevis]WNC16458.1 hypothetical protein RGB73_09110 [Brevibacillus brevis]